MRSGTTARPAVRLRPEQGGYRLEVELPSGTRSLRDADCRALFRAAIVIAALGEGAPAPTADIAPPPPSSEAGFAEQLSAPSPRRSADALRTSGDALEPVAAGDGRSSLQTAEPNGTRSPMHSDAVAAVAFHFGLTPVASAYLAAGAQLGRDRFRVRLLLGYLTPSTSERRGETRVRVDGVGGSLAADFRPLAWLTLTAGADLTLLHGKGVGALVVRSDWTSVPGLHAGLSLRLFESARFRLELPVVALFALARSRFLVNGQGALHRTDALGFRAGIQGVAQFR